MPLHCCAEKYALRGIFQRLWGCLYIADVKKQKDLTATHPAEGPGLWRAVGEAAPTPRCAALAGWLAGWLTAQERPGRRSRWGVFPIPGFDSVCVFAALSLVPVSSIVACGGLMTQFVWKNCNLQKPHLTLLEPTNTNLSRSDFF